MSDEPEKDNELSEFDLAAFINDWSTLFVVMGVFGAIAIYISQTTEAAISEAAMMIKVGFVAAFLLSLLILFLIYSKLKDRFGSWSRLYQAHLRSQNADLAFFTLFILLLVLSISTILTRQEPVIFLLLMTATIGLALIVFSRIIFGVMKIVPQTPTWRMSATFLTSVVMLAASYYLRIELMKRFTLSTINELSLSDPIPVLIDITIMLVATIQSLAAVAILATFFGIPVIVIDKIRGVGYYDQSG